MEDLHGPQTQVPEGAYAIKVSMRCLRAEGGILYGKNARTDHLVLFGEQVTGGGWTGRNLFTDWKQSGSWRWPGRLWYLHLPVFAPTKLYITQANMTSSMKEFSMSSAI